MTNKSKEEELAEKLHEWYLEATNQPESEYNPKAVVPYEDLSEGQKFLDRYIASKVLSLLASHQLEIVQKLEIFREHIGQYEARKAFDDTLSILRGDKWS